MTIISQSSAPFLYLQYQYQPIKQMQQAIVEPFIQQRCIYLQSTIEKSNDTAIKSEKVLDGENEETMSPHAYSQQQHCKSMIVTDVFQGSNSENSRSYVKQNSGQFQDQWPQIKSIVKKISRLETNLQNERKINKQSHKRVRIAQNKMKVYEDEINRHYIDLNKFTEQSQEYVQKIKQLTTKIEEKEQLLKEKDQIMQNIQITQVRKTIQMEEKYKKLSNQNKELMERLRKLNCELDKEKKFSKQLRSQMLSKIEMMQSQKEEYLVHQIQKLKNIIETTKQQKQVKLRNEIDQLNKKIYNFEDQMKRKDIQINLMERKKQQAIQETIDKKDQEVKVQKSLVKSITDKYAKLQEENKIIKQKNLEHIRNNKISNANKVMEEEVSLQLSPQRY